jgi:hypothetical protein
MWTLSHARIVWPIVGDGVIPVRVRSIPAAEIVRAVVILLHTGASNITLRSRAEMVRIEIGESGGQMRCRISS